MISSSHHIRKEEDLLNEFSHAFNELDANGWSAVFEPRFQWMKRAIRPDIVIKKDGRMIIVCELKLSSFHDAYKAAEEQALMYCQILQCPYYLAITNEKYALFDKNNNKITGRDKLLDSQDLKEILTSVKFDENFNKDEWDKAIDDLIKEINNIDDEIIDKSGIIDSLSQLSNNVIIHPEDRQIDFPPQMEDAFFQTLLPDLNEDELCRFSTFNSLFRTISQKKHSMCSIIAMNDKSEISYVSDYFQNNGGIYPGASYLNSPENWNTCFITSCCGINRANDFTMMRLYGDNAAGIVYKYKIDVNRIKNGFILKPVSYQRDNGSHPELEIINKLLAISVNGYVVTLQNLSVWQHFFKPKEYAFEEEVRLLYKLPEDNENSSSDIIWILNSEFNVITPIINFPVTETDKILPLIIEGITLGPKMTERESNLHQIQYLMALNKIENHSKTTITLSPVTHYRS